MALPLSFSFFLALPLGFGFFLTLPLGFSLFLALLLGFGSLFRRALRFFLQALCFGFGFFHRAIRCLGLAIGFWFLRRFRRRRFFGFRRILFFRLRGGRSGILGLLGLIRCRFSANERRLDH